MNIIRLSIERPIAVVAAVLMTVLFGLVALSTIPIQLAPDVNRPVISITTVWPGAAPAEVEREIINRQEEQMAGLEGLSSIEARAETGRARVTLEFSVTSNMDKSLLLVANRLDRVSGYPDEVRQPTLDTAGSEDNPIAWFNIRRLPGNERPIHEFGDFVEDVVKDKLERVAGVSGVSVFGGGEREIRVTVDPRQLARYRLTVSQVVRTLRAANASVSAGDVEEGKRRYVVRTQGDLTNLDDVRNIVLRSAVSTGGSGGRVQLSDIATVEFTHKTPVAKIRLLGEQALAMNATRETGANVIETMDGIRQTVDELNATVLPENGLQLIQSYDETVYIKSSIDLVQQNLWIGGMLAALVLMLFLRSLRATAVVTIAIPVSVIGAFVAMAALGRSINVVSLAGLAFAVGMVVDAAIVVMENIYRHRERGMSAKEAAYEGASQVWGAVLVSALTTVMVFIPILVMQLEVGQLFRDIAVAISVSVILSLLVSVTVIPALAKYLLGDAKPRSHNVNQGDTTTLDQINADQTHSDQTISRLRLPLIDGLAARFVKLIMGFVSWVTRSRVVSVIVVAVVTVIALAGSVLFLPKLEYLPEGNRNLVFGFIIPPPGYNLDTTTSIARKVEERMRPLWQKQHESDTAADDGATAEKADSEKPSGDAAQDDAPAVDRFFFVAFRSQSIFGAVATDPTRVGELIPIMRNPVFSEPGTFAVVYQPSIFGRGIGGGRRIELDISGPELESILGVAVQAFGKLSQIMPREEGNQLRPKPGLELGAPEIRVIPDRVRLADNGVSAFELAQTMDAFNDGMRVAQLSVGGKIIDLTLAGRTERIEQTQDIGNLPMVTADGRIVPISSLTTVTMTAGPTEIRHRERSRTITIDITPAQGIALETALTRVRGEVMQPLIDQGLPDGVKLNISGTANKLDATWDAMKWQLALAIVIVFLVMAVLFESFVYPLVIMLSVPVAAAGGIAGLVILNRFTFQPLDMLTLLGFVILIGIVVNNAILLVHQTLLHIRNDGQSPHEAIRSATSNRIRPIFMSTLTSVCGMLPLVVFPGSGSELYRGLGSVVVGGLSLSAVLTLLIVPPILALVVVPLERRNEQRVTIASATTPPVTK